MSGTIIPWEFDYKILLRACDICCLLAWIGATLLVIAATYWGLQAIDQVKDAPDVIAGNVRFYAVAGIVGAWDCAIFGIAFTHLICAWSLITSKAAQLYVENCEKK